MKGSGFIFDSVSSLHYKFHIINLNCHGLHIDSTDWINNKKPKINPMNHFYKWIQ